MAQKLKVAAKPVFKAPVHFNLAGNEVGETIEIAFTAEFKRLNSEQRKELLDNHVGPQKGDDKAVVDRVLANFSGLEDEEGQPFICTPENIDQAEAEWPGFIAAIVTSYFANASKAPGKNS
ncbi:phage tail assembly chaperone [Sphingomonas sp. NCPPB 2930]